MVTAHSQWSVVGLANINNSNALYFHALKKNQKIAQRPIKLLNELRREKEREREMSK